MADDQTAQAPSPSATAPSSPSEPGQPASVPRMHVPTSMIDQRMFWHLQQEVKFQCEFALHAFDELDRCFEHVDQTLAVRVFTNIHAILSAAAAISRLLFSSVSAERSRALRDAFGVPEDSILRSRGMRNHFEHFDERLDEWLPRTTDGSVIDMVASTERVDGVGPRYVLRMFNISTFEVTFADERFAFRPLVEAIRSLLAATKESIQRQPFQSGGEADEKN